MSHLPGGGPKSRNVVHPNIRTGGGSRSTNPGYVSQLGNKVGSHVTNKGDSGYRGEPFHSGKSFQPVPFGNEVALNVGKGGPGTGRTVYASGSQGTTGAPAPGNPEPQQGDILSGYGPESSRGR
jgi:hypothetical protein